jgi:DNA-binding YbaB/EbfC family protein
MGKGMRAGKKPGGSGNAMQKQMAQMQAMQGKMGEAQDEIDKMETSATSGGGAITVTVNGARQLTKVEIKPDAFDPEDIEMLEDLVLTATNEALRQIEEISTQEMNKLTGGLGIPGL